jgi:hypothetical protein
MRSPEEVERNSTVLYTTGRISLVFSLSFSMLSIWNVEHLLFAGKLANTADTWYFKAMVPFPWVMLAITGVGLSIDAKRGTVDRTKAGSLISAAAMTVLLSYGVLDGLVEKAIALAR